MEEVGPVTVPDENNALEALLERAKARDAAAETELHDRYRRFVRRRLEETRKRRNWFWLVDVESAVQEVFAQFFKAGLLNARQRRAFLY